MEEPKSYVEIRTRLGPREVKEECNNSTEIAYAIEEKDQATKSIQEDALVHGAEEGRDKLRKAAESCK